MTLEQQSLLIEAMVLSGGPRGVEQRSVRAARGSISDYIFEHVALLQDPPEGTFRDHVIRPGRGSGPR